VLKNQVFRPEELWTVLTLYPGNFYDAAFICLIPSLQAFPYSVHNKHLL